MNIYVGNLPYNLSESELQDLFAQYGEVTKASVIMDKATNRSKGFGFVDMPDNKAAEAAINALNEKEVKGRNLKINQARPKTDSAPQRRPRSY
jgi:RNA recognition motif-containing protein